MKKHYHPFDSMAHIRTRAHTDFEEFNMPLAYFEFIGRTSKKDKFIIKLVEEEKIEHARAILSGREQRVVHVKGVIVPKRAPYNPDWSYHLDPESITFFENAMEVCDSSMRYVEEHLAEIGGDLLPRCVWCPWSSTLVRELPASKRSKKKGPAKRKSTPRKQSKK